MSIKITKINRNISWRKSFRIMTKMWQQYVSTVKEEQKCNIPIINAKELRNSKVNQKIIKKK